MSILNWFRRRRDAQPVSASPRVPTALEGAAEKLERAWQQRRFGDWQPSNGWLIDQPRGKANVAYLRIERAKRQARGKR